MKRGLILIAFLSLIASNSCVAGNVIQVSRYLTISNKPKLAQVDLLSQTIQVRFPQNIQTIGDAINYLLRPSGYSLVGENQRNIPLKIMLSKRLPIIDRQFGPMTLKDGLNTLSGSAFDLSQDPLNREVNFLLKPQYQKFMKNRTI